MDRLPVGRAPPRSREGVSLQKGMTVFVMRSFESGEQWWQGRVESVEWNFEPHTVGVSHPPEAGSSSRWSSYVPFQDCPRNVAIVAPDSLGGTGTGRRPSPALRPSRPAGAAPARTSARLCRTYPSRSAAVGLPTRLPFPGPPRSLEGVVLKD